MEPTDIFDLQEEIDGQDCPNCWFVGVLSAEIKINIDEIFVFWN
jgi:hypothetical protein